MICLFLLIQSVVLMRKNKQKGLNPYKMRYGLYRAVSPFFYAALLLVRTVLWPGTPCPSGRFSRWRSFGGFAGWAGMCGDQAA